MPDNNEPTAEQQKEEDDRINDLLERAKGVSQSGEWKIQETYGDETTPTGLSEYAVMDMIMDMPSLTEDTTEDEMVDMLRAEGVYDSCEVRWEREDTGEY